MSAIRRYAPQAEKAKREMLPKIMGIVRWRRGLEVGLGGEDEGWGLRVGVLD